MALYAIGDIQGCKDSLDRLLDRLRFDPAEDRLWLVGDLVNRGPKSLEVLRWAAGLGDRVVAVLGNHDLHLLARAADVSPAKRRDTLDAVLAAHDRDALIDWLRRRPLVHVEDGWIVVHAGLHPRWSVDDARALAGELEAALRSDEWKTVLGALHAPEVDWSPALAGAARTRALLAWLTRVRMCTPDGRIASDFDGHPREAPKGLVPWFRAPGRAWATHVPVFGHWAALGLDVASGHVALDSGCVWGGKLTAIRLPERALTAVACEERDAD
jgi:bis(5'-nucleosyl)-tetraphosphatase (symmetrical)